MHKSSILILVALLLAGGQPVRASSEDSEAARIAAVVAPTTDFSKPERYERLPGGAATSTKFENRDAFSQPSAEY